MQGIKCYKCGRKAHSHGYQPNGVQRFKCPNLKCDVITFNSRKFTPLYRMKLSNRDIFELVYLFFTGYPIGKMAGLKGVTEKTIRNILKKSIKHFEKYEKYKISYEEYVPEILQFDEIWIKLQGKKIFFGWVAYDPRNKVIIDFEIGGRDNYTLGKLLKRLKKYRNKIKLIMVDGYKGYRKLISKYLGKKRSRPTVGVINKSKYSKKLKGFVTYGLFGKGRIRVEKLIRELGVGNKISTSLIERLNRDFRDCCSYLKRRTHRVCRILEWIIMWLKGYRIYHNICKPHLTLSKRSSKNWIKEAVTPAMKINIVPDVVDIMDVLTLPIPH